MQGVALLHFPLSEFGRPRARCDAAGTVRASLIGDRLPPLHARPATGLLGDLTIAIHPARCMLLRTTPSLASR